MNVLFLCTGNSARSILGEVIFNDLFSKYGYAFSAGSKPMGKVNPLALKVLQNHGHNTGGLQSQPVDEFLNKPIDLVISVCDSAAQDCPIWPGKGTPERLHWPLPDPKNENDFEGVYEELKIRLSDFLSRS